MNYYAEKLNSISLFQAYDTALPRVQQYLDAEIAYVQSHLSGQETLLEIGAGYGRIIKQLSPYVARCIGIDISERSVQLGNAYVQGCQNCSLAVMDAHQLSFGPEFDIVLCLQNGLSAMKGEPENLVRQSLQVLRPGGKAFFSTYSPKFWEPRLQWFREQASKGLLGDIDEAKTKDGVIICKDGFRADTFTAEQLDALGARSACRYHLQEVDESSLFLVLYKH